MDTSDLHIAADNHEIGATGRSMLDSASDVVTKGIPLTGLSVYNSFVNTGVDVANFFGGSYERNDPVKQLQGYDDNLAQYYTEHADAIEAAGLIAGSLIPGTVAIKALKLAQTGRFGQNIARATGLMSGKRDAIMKTAIEEINAGESSLYGTIQRDKWKAIAYGFGDQALQAAAFEGATIATMKANPLLDKDGLTDVMSHMVWGTLVGGGIGGVIEGIGIRGILNKALLDQDMKEKAFDLATRLGIGNFTAGDRVVKLIESIDAMPAPTTVSASAKATRTRTQAEIESWKILKDISPEADENLGKAFLDTLYKMRNESGLSREEMYDYLGRLNRVSRVNEFSNLPQEKVFYVNKLAKDDAGKSLDRLITSNPDEASEVSLSYTVTRADAHIQVARFSDSLESDAGAIRKYETKKAAFDDGQDIYIDNKLQVHVNPDSQNIRRVPRPGESRALSEDEERIFRKTGKLPDGSDRLNGAPVYFNILTGEVKNTARAVIGDLAPIENTSKLLNYDSRGRVTGIKVGDFSSTHYVESGFNYHDLSSLDANARYVWAHLRGLEKNDIIHYNDLPMLEEAFRNWGKDSGKTLDTLNIRIRQADGELTPLNTKTDNFASTMATLRRRKDEVIAELLGDGSKSVDAEAVALKANVTPSYIERGLQGEDHEWMRPIGDSMKVNHVKLEYDIGDLNVQEGNILRGLIDVQYRIDMAKDQALSAVANYFGGDWNQFVLPSKSSDANILGAGPGAFSFANAEYGTLGQKVEGVGANVSKKMQERRSYVSERLSNELNSLKDDPEAAAELALITNIGRRISRRYTFLPEDVATKYKVSTDTIVLEDALRRDPQTGAITGWDKTYVPRDGNWFLGSRMNKGEKTPEGAFTYYELNSKVAKFLKSSTELNDERLVHLNNWRAAQGIADSYNLGAVYFPPVDTTRYKYVAIVRDIEGKGWGTSDAAAIVADSAEGLQKKVALLGDGYRISFKGTSKDYHEALGDYDYAMNMVESQVDSTLRKKGILSDVLPNMRGEAAIKEYFDWHIRQEERQVRNFVELGNAQLFAELRALGKKFVEVETSQTGPVAGRLFRQVKDPFNQYIKTALNISEKQEYRLWQDANEKLEAFFSTAFRTAKETLGQADKGLISYEKANELTQKFGLGNPYERTLNALEAYKEATRLPLQPVLSRFVQKANSVLAATTLRLDAFQTLINVVSTPVLLTAEFASAKANPALKQLLTTELPDGSGATAPAYSKVLFQSVQNFFGPEKVALLERYRKLGTVRELSSEYHEMLDSLSISGSETAKKLEEMGEKAVKLGVKISGADWGEEFVRFVASDSARQLFEALGHSGQGLDDNIRTFVNRVHGNYIAAQRPIAFQGPIGQAIGLFQTYQFNLLQQVFRMVENKEKLPAALLFGIQGSLFGLQGLPGFQAINTHIVGNAANNPSHMDFYSQVPQFFDKKMGDWLLYGSVSNILSTGLYSRGDINPRQISILPVNPLEYPAIGAGIRFVKNLIDVGERLKDGGRFSDTVLQGLEHNGLSRPLTGLAQVVQGYTTTSKASLISASNDWASISSAARIAGARPLDEAVALDALYRKTAYQAKDTARIQQLGEAVKASLIGNRELGASELESFAARYAAEGGRIENFGRKMIEWTRDANQSTANSIYRSLRSPLNQNMMKIMGGEQLPDFINLPSSVTATAPSQ
jgi:hypothetical protein